ncbi:MAG: rhodanese-like domain-containing protein [Candidatus Thiodiazotropha sp.]
MYFRSIQMIISAAVIAVSAGSVYAEGNRYNLERDYHSEISAAQAFKELKLWSHIAKHKKQGKPVLIDVRSLEEYATGHPLGAHNIPYPRVCTDCDPQPEETFYWEVYNTVHGDTDRLIMTLCRTGKRSVSGGNVLANPAKYGIDGPAFTNVRNIWEGFVGQYKYAYESGTIMLDTNHEPFALDLNNNGVMDSDSADVYEEQMDANPDKDGWRNFQQLPWTTKIRHRLAYMRDPDLYKMLTLTPVE